MSIAIFPVLRSNIQTLQNPRDILKGVLQYYFHNPTSINDTFRNLEISFIYDNAANTGIQNLKNAMVMNLTNVLKRYFQNGGVVDVNVEHKMIDAVRFELYIDALVTISGISYSVTQNFSVDKDGHLQYTFDSL